MLARRVRQTDAGTHTGHFLPIVAEALQFVVLVDSRAAFAESSKSWGERALAHHCFLVRVGKTPRRRFDTTNQDMQVVQAVASLEQP